MGRIKSTTLRFNLSKPEQQTAWEYLQNLDREKFKSVNHAITLAVCDFFERQKRAESDPFFESREREEMFVRRILEAVEQALEKGLAHISDIISTESYRNKSRQNCTARRIPHRQCRLGLYRRINNSFFSNLEITFSKE